MTSLVFDATALSHFARASRTDELRTAVADDEPVLLAEVATELARGVPGYPALGSAAAGGRPARNNGEAAVLAWVSVNGGVAIIDEVAARAIGARERLPVHGSLWLLIRSFKSRLHDRATVEAIVDDLLYGGMSAKFGSSGAQANEVRAGGQCAGPS